MLIISGLLCAVYIILFFLSRKKYTDIKKKIIKKENPLRILYPFAYLVYMIKQAVLGKSDEQFWSQRFQKLYPKGNGTDEYMFYILKRNSLILAFIMLMLLCSFLSGLSSIRKEKTLGHNVLRRPEEGRDKSISILLYSDEMRGRELELPLRKKRLRGEELQDYFYETQDRLLEVLLGENDSFDCVRFPLCFADELKDPGMRVQWRSLDTDVIRLNGTLNHDHMPEEGIITYVSLILTYYEEESMDVTIPVHVYPKEYTEDDYMIKEFKRLYHEQEEESIYDSHVVLPEQVMGQDVYYEEKRENNQRVYLLYSIVAIILIYFVMQNDIKKKEKQREKQMMLDYSNIISKFTLFISSGMTIRGAWECIVMDYERSIQNQKGKQQLRFAYDEMLTTVHEIQIGVSESKAYENFGRRCMLISYVRFATILVQNLKKGTKGILPLLEMEEKQAFSERKELAKRVGEEAGTKLQIPLMIYLIIVFVIVLMPALISL